MDTNSLRDAVQRIDEAAKDCQSQHKADVEFLQAFFRETVEQADEFLRKVEKLGLLDAATIDARLLITSLSKCLTYVEDRSSDSVWRYMIQSALMPTSESSYSVTSRDLENEAKAAVREGIIEPVIVPLEHAMRRGGSPLQQRANGVSSLELMFAIEDMDRALRFGYSEMVAYDKRIGDERKIDVLVRSMEQCAISNNLLLDKVDEMAEAMYAMRVSLEEGGCPLVFFLAPPADTKHTWLDKARRLDVLNTRMDLHFVCRVFFDDLRDALSQGLRVQPNPMMSSEFSLPLEVKNPRKFVKKIKPVMKLSLLIINLITHAAASGIGIGGFIPNLDLSEHEAMLEIMKEDLEGFDEETGSDFPAEDSSDVHGSAGVPDLKLLHGSAREGMQRYLEEHHATTWQEQVETNLKIAISTKNGRAFVCRHNLPHEEKWKKSGQAHTE